MKSWMKVFLISTLAIVFLGYLIFLNIPKFLNVQKIVSYIEKKTNLEIVLENFSIKPKFNLSYEISFDSLKINNQNKENLAHIKGFASKNLKEINIETLNLIIRKLPKENLEFEKYINLKKKLNINIKNYNVAFLNKTEFSGKNFTFNSNRKNIETNIQANIRTGGNVAPFEFYLKGKNTLKNTSLKDYIIKLKAPNVNLEILSPYLALSNLAPKDIKGKANIDIYSNKENLTGEIIVSNLKITDENYNIKQSKIIKIMPNLSFEKDSLNISSTSIKSEKIDVLLNGEIKNYLSKNPELNLNCRLKNTSLDEITWLAPNFVEKQLDAIRKLKKYGADATLNGEISISGNPITPNIEGIIDIANIIVLKNKLKLPPSYGTVEFKKDRADIFVHALAGSGEWVDIKGIAELYGAQAGEFKITSSKNVNLGLAETILLPVQDVVVFPLGPVPLLDVEGFGSIDLFVKGTRTKGILEGWFKFKNAKVKFKNTNTGLHSGSGTILFKKDKISFNGISAKLKSAPVKINGNADIEANIFMDILAQDVTNNDIYEIIKENVNETIIKKFEALNQIKFKTSTNIQFKHKFDIDFANIKLSELGLSGKTVFINSADQDIKQKSGQILIKNNKIKTENLNLAFKNADILLNSTIENLFNIELNSEKSKFTKPNFKGNLKLNNFVLNSIKEELNKFFPQNKLKILSNFEDFDGAISANIDFNNSDFDGDIELSNISCLDKIKQVKILVNSGKIKLKKDKLTLDALNINYGEIPIYFNAIITNLKSRPYLDSRFAISLNESNVDKYINKNLVYPIKIKGEVLGQGILKGYSDDYMLYTTSTLNPNNDIYYMGANLGDEVNKRELKTVINFKGNSANIHKIEYLKYIVSQNNRPTALPMLRISGNILSKNKNITLDNLRIKTLNPTSTRIFNILFKKSILKQGQFTSDIVLSGNGDNLKITGDATLDKINIPLYNAKINNAKFNFQNDIVISTFMGQAYNSDVLINTIAENKTKLPLVINKMDIESQTIDIGKIIKEFSTFNTINPHEYLISNEQLGLNPKDLIIKEGEFMAENVILYNINAKNMQAKFNLAENSPLKYRDAIFDIAGGEVKSEGEYNFNTNSVALKAKINSCEADDLTKSFLGVSGQIYGKLDGEVTLSASKLNTAAGIKTLKSDVWFEIKNGKMPKLGSLEYLIRAGNLYKSGVFGLTLNNVIDVLIPYKTGEFQAINGNLHIQEGTVEKLEIFTQGENMSLYLAGSYNILENFANIELLGRLSKKISTLLGPVGNASLNSVINFASGNKKFETDKNEIIKSINKIPLIEISGDDFRIFSAKILGDINKNNYIKAFNWLN
ncbi:hypothetical protein IJC60_04455 [bacterium]|nr:hypothetical protein [bacterium]